MNNKIKMIGKSKDDRLSRIEIAKNTVVHQGSVGMVK